MIHMPVRIPVRLEEEDKELLERIAKHYGISKSDVLRMALKEFAKSHGFNSAQQA
jgi:antitoxin component of RelBE/YafQ-DinJ toxin-antitoxin module